MKQIFSFKFDYFVYRRSFLHYTVDVSKARKLETVFVITFTLLLTSFPASNLFEIWTLQNAEAICR